jgi:tRNA G18 (ribose-2'-O)-methylase SpoU
MTLVDHPDDPRIADFLRLTDAQWRVKVEAEHGMFVAEGHLVIDQVLRLGLRVRSVLVSQSRYAVWQPAVDAPVYVASQDVIDEVAGFHAHRGALAAVERPKPMSVDDVVGRGRHLLVIEDVSDHENLGALFRNAAAFGLGGVLLSPGCCDPLYRRSVRVSMGHVLTVPWAYCDAWPVALPDHTVVALTPSGDDVLGFEPLGERVALMVGAEGPGLSAAALAAGDRRVRIPIAAGVDSLNVATAAAVAMSTLFSSR